MKMTPNAGMTLSAVKRRLADNWRASKKVNPRDARYLRDEHPTEWEALQKSIGSAFRNSAKTVLT
jgi:hypothetical protein